MDEMTLSMTNDVLHCYGLSGVQNITDSEASQFIAETLPIYYRKLLSMGDWCFAMKARRLTQVSLNASDKIGYAHAYDIPRDLARLYRVEHGCRLVRIGAYYFSASEPVDIIYIAYDIPFAQMPVYVRIAFAYFVAFNLCNQITKNITLRKQLENDFEQYFADAQMQNKLESMAA